MKRLSRRSFFGLFSREDADPPVDDRGARGRVERPRASGSAEWRKAKDEPGAMPPAAGRARFSLEEFYRARGPQKLPPIVIRPEVLRYPVATTSVGLAPAHEAPRLDDDPLYAELSSSDEVDS